MRQPPTTARAGARRRGFSLLEMLVALAISGALLTATLAALDNSFKQYKVTTESASTHVVTRIVMHRMLALVRTGSDFGPQTTDPLDPNLNPVVSNFVEFVTQRDIDGGITRVTRLEFLRDGERSLLEGPPPPPLPGEDIPEVDPSAPGTLWYYLVQPASPPVILEKRPLLTGVQQALFTLQFDEFTWRLDRCTIDLTVEPNDSEDLVVGTDGEAEAIRLVASATPRGDL